MQSVYNGDFQNSPPVSSLLSPTYSLKKKKKTIYSKEHWIAVLQKLEKWFWNQNGFGSGLNDAASTIP